MISDLVKNISPSPTIGLVGKVTELKKAGKDIISFHLGEPDFRTPDHIAQAGKKAIDDGYTRYTATEGVLPLRQAICKKLHDDNKVDYKPSQICCSTGAKQVLVNIFQTICNHDDEIIIPTPCWVSYVEIVKMAYGKSVLVPTNEKDGFQLDLSAIEKAITKRTRAIIITNPNNPTGAVYSKESLEGILALAEKYDFYIVADEIYEKLIYGDAEFVSIASLSPKAKDRTIIVNGFSKTYAMTGWRIGYSAAPDDIAKGIADLQSHTTSNCCSISQYAAIAALEGPQDSVEMMRLEYDRRCNYLIKRLREMPGITCADVKGAFYLMPNISSYYGKQKDGFVIKDSLDFCNYMLDEAGISIVPGSAFEAPQNIRISYSNSIEEIERGMDRMQAALSLLK